MKRRFVALGLTVAVTASVLAPAASAASREQEPNQPAPAVVLQPRDLQTDALKLLGDGLASFLKSSDYSPLQWVKMVNKCGKIDPSDPLCKEPTTDMRLDDMNKELAKIVGQINGLQQQIDANSEKTNSLVNAVISNLAKGNKEHRSEKLGALRTHIPEAMKQFEALQACVVVKADGTPTCGDAEIKQRRDDFRSYTQTNLPKEGIDRMVSAFTGDTRQADTGLANAFWEYAVTQQNVNGDAKPVFNTNGASTPVATKWLADTMQAFLAEYQTLFLAYGVIWPISEAMSAELARSQGITSTEEKYIATEAYLRTINNTVSTRILGPSEALNNVHGTVQHYTLPELEQGQIVVAAPDQTRAMIYSAKPFTGGAAMNVKDFEEFSVMIRAYAEPSKLMAAYPASFPDITEPWYWFNGKHPWYTVNATTTMTTVFTNPFALDLGPERSGRREVFVLGSGTRAYEPSDKEGEPPQTGPNWALAQRAVGVRLTDNPVTWRDLQAQIARFGAEGRTTPLLERCYNDRGTFKVKGWCGLQADGDPLLHKTRFENRAARQVPGTSMNYVWDVLGYSSVAGFPRELNYGVMGPGNFVRIMSEPVAGISWINRPGALKWKAGTEPKGCPSCSDQGSQADE